MRCSACGIDHPDGRYRTRCGDPLAETCPICDTAALGDGLLAYFGDPEAHQDDARHAVHAGLGRAGGGGNDPEFPDSSPGGDL